MWQGEGNAKKEIERERENETKIEISMNYIHGNCHRWALLIQKVVERAINGKQNLLKR